MVAFIEPRAFPKSCEGHFQENCKKQCDPASLVIFSKWSTSEGKSSERWEPEKCDSIW